MNGLAAKEVSENSMALSFDAASARGAAKAHPNLALIKYWGKLESHKNLPATPSLAVTLDGLVTQTTVELSAVSPKDPPNDSVRINGEVQPRNRFESFFAAFRKIVAAENSQLGFFTIRASSHSNYSSSAGLASSAAGFAALSLACFQAAGIHGNAQKMSSLARVGSASAARSIWGGFTQLETGAETARPLYDENWWEDLRIVVVELDVTPKSPSSREAMERTRLSSPYYSAWLDDSRKLMDAALGALAERNLDELGPLIRSSYLRMFASMFAANPPIIYWKPSSLRVIRACEALRRDGIGVWETMDAGPQVKLLILERNLPTILAALSEIAPDARLRVCCPGEAARML